MSKKEAFQNKGKAFLPYFIILVVSFFVLLKPLGNGDELWNYNFAKNILRGNVPYKDFSIVQTPLSCYVSAIFLGIFGEGLFSFRILTYALFVSISFLMYWLSERLTNNSIVALCGTAVTMSTHFMHFIYNYNYLSTVVLLLIFVLEIRDKKELKNNLLIGLLVGATLAIKQNTGALIWFANVIICVRRGMKYATHKKVYIYRVIMSFIPMAVYSVYLMCVGAFGDFLEYAVSGISTFTHRYTLMDFFRDSSIFIGYFGLIIAVFFLIGVKIYREGINEFQFGALLFSVAWSSIIYPLADLSHVLLVLIPLTPTFFAFYGFRNVKRKMLLVGLVEVSFAFQFMILVVIIMKADFYVSELPNYKGVFIVEETEVDIKSVDNYIVEKEKAGYKVRIADVSSAIYTIPLGRYEKNWDMLLVGNIGANSIEELLGTDTRTLYLINKAEELKGLQHHFELIQYIKDNYSCIDELEHFYVYEAK